MSTYLITGGSGFIGSNFILRLLREHPEARVVNLDKLTYAGNPHNLRDVEHDEGYRFVRGDVCDPNAVRDLVAEADYIVHFAAESHVDRSLLESGSFITSEVLGTYVLLDAARHSRRLKRFLHISTDEVYGDVEDGVYSVETDLLHPRSPYSASKAGAEMQVIAYVETYGLPIVVARPANNVGPRQHVEKFVPLCTTNALNDLPLPIYGDGKQQRDWLFVGDNVEALDLILHEGEPGEIYNVGARNHRYNIDVAEYVLNLLGRPTSLIRHVADRAGHDRRYGVDFAKIARLGWSPRHDFLSAIEETVRWYEENRWWWESVRDKDDFKEYYDKQYGERLATAKPYSAN
ncbi:MAG TPA: dTDP-glucose 4,6-dehydratase [Dehalococcoidia bacterium]|jgi:dTDP-glucose 4,6-dehydratase|nr:dTDP-glucose 4,6-dehydratase [Dehalococcoidia bacterium]